MFTASVFSTVTTVGFSGSFHPSCDTVSSGSLYDWMAEPVAVTANTRLSRTVISEKLPSRYPFVTSLIETTRALSNFSSVRRVGAVR